MKIIVKISDIEIEVHRPNFEEWKNLEAIKETMKDTVLPTLEAMTETAIELYNNRFNKLSQ